jgi:hypothetical protein
VTDLRLALALTTMPLTAANFNHLPGVPDFWHVVHAWLNNSDPFSSVFAAFHDRVISCPIQNRLIHRNTISPDVVTIDLQRPPHATLTDTPPVSALMMREIAHSQHNP